MRTKQCSTGECGRCLAGHVVIGNNCTWMYYYPINSGGLVRMDDYSIFSSCFCWVWKSIAIIYLSFLFFVTYFTSQALICFLCFFFLFWLRYQIEVGFGSLLVGLHCGTFDMYLPLFHSFFIFIWFHHLNFPFFSRIKTMQAFNLWSLRNGTGSRIDPHSHHRYFDYNGCLC